MHCNQTSLFPKVGFDAAENDPTKVCFKGAAACTDWNATLDWDASAALSPAELEHVARHGLSRFGCEEQLGPVR